MWSQDESKQSPEKLKDKREVVNLSDDVVSSQSPHTPARRRPNGHSSPSHTSPHPNAEEIADLRFVVNTYLPTLVDNVNILINRSAAMDDMNDRVTRMEVLPFSSLLHSMEYLTQLSRWHFSIQLANLLLDPCQQLLQYSLPALHLHLSHHSDLSSHNHHHNHNHHNNHPHNTVNCHN